MTSAEINTIDYSNNNISIGSSKGTFHIFKTSKNENDIFENSSEFDYNNYEQILQKIKNAVIVDKIKLCNNYIYNEQIKSTSKIIHYNSINIDNDSILNQEHFKTNKYNKNIKGTVIFTFSNLSTSVHCYYLEEKKAVLLKKLEMKNFPNKDEAIDQLHSSIAVINTGSKKTKNFLIKNYIDLETTNKNIINLHSNSFFNINMLTSNFNSLLLNKIKSNKAYLKIENSVSFYVTGKKYFNTLIQTSSSNGSNQMLSEVDYYNILLKNHLKYEPRVNQYDKNLLIKNDNLIIDNTNNMYPKVVVYPNTNQNIPNNYNNYNIYNSNENPDSFYKNKDNILENQLKKAIDGNIMENFSSEGLQVKKNCDFNIDYEYINK